MSEPDQPENQPGLGAEDSVEEEFGNEYSEDTLNLLREIRKPTWEDAGSSLDPEDDFLEYLQYDIKVPPPVYDAISKQAELEVSQLQELKSKQLSKQQEQEIECRRQLVQDAAPEDIQWLKLKAYHRAMDKIRAAHASKQRQESLPTDSAPLKSRSLLGLALPRNSNQLPELHEESEGPEDALSVSYLPSIPASRSATLLGQERLSPSADLGSARTDAFGQLQQGNQPEVDLLDLLFPNIKTYTPEYLEHERLKQLAAQQKRQRSMAFWVGIGVVLGTCALRALRRWRRRHSNTKLTKQTAV